MSAVFDESHCIYRYKYLPFNEGSLKTLSERTIKFASPLEFNDPFDCLPHYDDSELDDLPRNRKDLYRRAGDDRGLSPAGRIQSKGKLIATLRRRIRDGSFARDLLRDVSVVSLSKNALNIPMWSHYADFHQGFVLEFRIPTMGTRADLAVAADLLVPFPVHYSESRPVINVARSPTDELVKEVLLTKSSDWRYEEEERVVEIRRKPGIYPYARDLILESVIAGMKMTAENRQRLEQEVATVATHRARTLTLYHAKEVGARYALTVPGHPRLDHTLPPRPRLETA